MNNKKRIKKVYLKTSNDNYINDVMNNQKEIIAINAKEHCKIREHYCDILSDMIIKAAMMKESFDNVSCIVIELKE